MFAWLSKKVPSYSSAFFPGTWPLRKDGFGYLGKYGIEAADGPDRENAHWSLRLRHPQWGEAILASLRNVPMPPHTLIDLDANLIPEEAEEIKKCGSCVSIFLESSKGHILRDRKSALCFLEAVLGDDGVAGLDHVAQKFWTRTELELETAHSADLDVEGILVFHGVTGPEGSAEAGKVQWLHTHGLGEIGSYDFDILRPAEELGGIGRDLVRCIAFAILEGELRPGVVYEPLRGQRALRAVPASEFMEKASASDRMLRGQVTEEHTKNRVVLCDPVRKGLFGKFLGDGPRPSELLSGPFNDHVLIAFSDEASELMSERANATFNLFAAIAEELREFQCTPLLKLRYETDGEKGGAEHLWFEYHGMARDEVDATLQNEPFRISGMKMGQRAKHSRERLSDWSIFTPAGVISPRSTKVLRFIRSRKEELREALKSEQGEAGGTGG